MRTARRSSLLQTANLRPLPVFSKRRTRNLQGPPVGFSAMHAPACQSQELSCYGRQLEAVLSAVLGAFQLPGASSSAATANPDSPSAGPAAAAVAELQAGGCGLQLHALRFLERVLAAEPGSLGVLRRLGLWELVYGPAFFHVGQAALQPQVIGALHDCS